MKLNYIFNNMDCQTLITLIVVCVTMIAPKHMCNTLASITR